MGILFLILFLNLFIYCMFNAISFLYDAIYNVICNVICNAILKTIASTHVTECLPCCHSTVCCHCRDVFHVFVQSGLPIPTYAAAFCHVVVRLRFVKLRC